LHPTASQQKLKVMKNVFLKSARALLFSLVTITAIHAQAALPPHPSDSNVPPHLNLSVTIPAAWQSQIVRQDFENESVCSLKNGNNTPVFLFSVTRVTGDQWMTIKDQMKNYTIIENKDNFITFVQKTDVRKIKGTGDAQYQQVLQQVDGMIATIRLN